MATFQGFVGPSYRSQSVNADCERLMNWMVEPVESPVVQTPSRAVLYPTPGLKVYVSGLDGPCRGAFAQDGRVFVVCGQFLYELTGFNTAVSLGNVGNDNQPASLASNGHGGHQLLVVSAGNGYIFDLNSAAFTQITSSGFPTNAVMVDFMDGYFIVMQAGTSSFFLSKLFDGLVWTDPAQVGQVSSVSDNLTAIRVLGRNLWLVLSGRTEVWYNSGATFPFQPVDGALMEQGTSVPWSLSETPDGLVMVASDERGTAMVVRSNGYSWQRISTYAVERSLTQVQTLSEGVGTVYQEQGHTFYVLTFPTTGPTWVYDFTTGLWHERGVWNDGSTRYEAQRQINHCYAFGQHFVGDRTTGTIYTQSVDYPTEETVDGVQRIRRERTCPHLNREQQWNFYAALQVDMEMGLGTADGDGATPLIGLSWSDDGGHAFTAPRYISAGREGQYRARAIWRLLGRSRDRVFRVVTDAVTPMRLLTAYLNVTPGTSVL